MTVLAMRHGELSRFDRLMRVERGELRVDDAAGLLGLKRRQIFRLLDRLRTDGAEGLVSRKRGRPSNRRHKVAFYSDKHSAFRNNRASANGDGMSHLGRALETLNIELICANSPQAKGRVERANGTLQDRLVKAMRLEGISGIEEANAFLPSYMARHNERFVRPPFDPRDLHRPLAPHDDLTGDDGVARGALGHGPADAPL